MSLICFWMVPFQITYEGEVVVIVVIVIIVIILILVINPETFNEEKQRSGRKTSLPLIVNQYISLHR